jgi:hypothetical protein
VLSYTYELPFGRESQGVVKQLAAGWQIMGIHSFNTGTPFTVHARTDFSNSGGDARPDIVPGVSTEPPGGRNRAQWFNPAAFQDPAPGQYGNVGRNTLSSPGTISIDLSIFKNFNLSERARLQFRSEFFNLPNHPNFRGIDTTYDSPSAGQLSTASAARQIQFALKLLF